MPYYESSFTPSSYAEGVLRSGKIVGEDESPAAMVERVATTIGNQELAFTSDPEHAQAFTERFGQALDSGEVIMSTPIMTNAGRHTERPLAACTVPTTPLDLQSRIRLRDEILTLHEQGMGTGFNLDYTQDPVETLRFLNRIAIESANSGREERPVGNMAVLSVYHPHIDRFIEAKVDAPSHDEVWKFNISVKLDDAFMRALEKDGVITLANGSRRHARDIFDKLSQAATVCADPGILFLDRMNARNPVPGLGEYQTTAPCAEVGLVEGETCQFGYINLGKFIKRQGDTIVIDYSRLEEITVLMTRVLDNSLEISQNNFIDPVIQEVASQKRKIGIGLCGVADAISHAGLPYDSPEAREIMRDVLSFINFASKEASVRLAEERGSFGAMNYLITGNRHLETPEHLTRLYGDLDTNTVDAASWRALARRIRETRKLRHVSTIALPPTGRSALIIDASTGVEPHFDPLRANAEVRSSLETILRSKYGTGLYAPDGHTPDVARILANAHQVHPLGHLGMVAALQDYTDEAISKTVNFPQGTTPDQVGEIYREGYQKGLSGVTVYVDGSHHTQPKHVR